MCATVTHGAVYTTSVIRLIATELSQPDCHSKSLVIFPFLVVCIQNAREVEMPLIFSYTANDGGAKNASTLNG